MKILLLGVDHFCWDDPFGELISVLVQEKAEARGDERRETGKGREGKRREGKGKGNAHTSQRNLKKREENKTTETKSEEKEEKETHRNPESRQPAERYLFLSKIPQLHSSLFQTRSLLMRRLGNFSRLIISNLGIQSRDKHQGFIQEL